MKLFVKFPLISVSILCGLAQAQYGNSTYSDPVSENGVIVNISDDKIYFYQPASKDGKKKETYGSIQINGDGTKQTELDVKVDEYDGSQFKAQNKKLKIDETDGKFEVKINNVVGDKEYEEKRGHFNADTNEFVTESCTGMMTSSGDCVVQENNREAVQPQRVPTSMSKERMEELMQLEPNSFPSDQ